MTKEPRIPVMVFLTAVGGKHRIIKRLENDDPMNALAGFGILAIYDVVEPSNEKAARSSSLPTVRSGAS